MKSLRGPWDPTSVVAFIREHQGPCDFRFLLWPNWNGVNIYFIYRSYSILVTIWLVECPFHKLIMENANGVCRNFCIISKQNSNVCVMIIKGHNTPKNMPEVHVSAQILFHPILQIFTLVLEVLNCKELLHRLWINSLHSSIWCYWFFLLHLSGTQFLKQEQVAKWAADEKDSLKQRKKGRLTVPCRFRQKIKSIPLCPICGAVFGFSMRNEYEKAQC